ncbi:EAL domain-containing protein [Anaerocolumna xylanovorans]|uniref:PAS domain S-box-containing protein/diguanylate cyclase (GGDEF) domain-containing protein n=1 Tax=Anaerocolumna xylanovorans DSM 12503 TaxID=1121345 RepID=A0A1M7Y1P3_9FIRM|nr:EAL domain-containing protein [Anaerocolumna xylanovorans]SHO45565.1 PAS domain S-box-containing protein/diguanylate cyclase (GGDEF) domain-containing protein [Anaerocolumna xylanovorans DSM 12503]
MEIPDNFNRTIIENMIGGFALHSIITDENGRPIDYRYMEANKSFEKYTGLKREEIIGRTILEIVPEIDEDTISWIQFFGQVALTGIANSTEQYSKVFKRWYRVNSYCPKIGYFAVIFMDITELREKTEDLNVKNNDLSLLLEEQTMLLSDLEKSQAALRMKNETLEKLSKELRKNEERLNNAQRIAKVGNWELDLKTNMLWGSEEAFHIYEIERTTPVVPLARVKELPLGDYKNISEQAFDKLLKENVPYDVRYEMVSEDGFNKYIRSMAALERGKNGNPVKLIGIIQDITEDILHERELAKKNEELSSLYEEILASEEELRQQNEVLFQKNEEITGLYEELTAQEEELKANYEQLNENMDKLKKSEAINSLILETAAEGVWQYDISTDTYTISPRFVKALGYQFEDIKSLTDIIDITHPDDRELAAFNFNEHFQGKTDKFDCEYRLMCKDGSCLWVRSAGKVLKHLDGRPYVMAGSFLDITKLKEQQLKLEHMAYHDMLTDLPNRSLFLFELDKALKETAWMCKKLAVIFIDLDNFKDVNDTLGHSTGDLLLKSMASRLKEHIRKQDMLTRLGGDEFAVMIRDIDSEEEVYEFCLRIKEKVLEPFEFNGYRFNISPSMGISMYPNNAANGEELLKNADTAMYRSKSIGKNTIQFYQDFMRKDMLRRLSIESHLRNALKKNIFTLHYQPQICLKTGTIRAFEALIRWTDEELGMISPSEFIPVAESAGLIVPLGEWILKEACKEAKRLNSGQNKILMSVNISAVQLKQLDFVDLVKNTLKETGLKPELLELEVTETTLISSFETTISMFEELRKIGVKISLDDFGTGYSSLSYLKKLPIDTLKIDKSFIKDLDKECIEKEITESIVALVHKLNIEVIAEGVENGKQLAYLMQCNCDNIQGFLISKPVPAISAKELLNKNYMAYIGVQVS